MLHETEFVKSSDKDKSRIPTSSLVDWRTGTVE